MMIGGDTSILILILKTRSKIRASQEFKKRFAMHTSTEGLCCAEFFLSTPHTIQYTSVYMIKYWLSHGPIVSLLVSGESPAPSSQPNMPF